MIANSFYYNLDRMEELSLLLFILYGICRVKLKNRLTRQFSTKKILQGHFKGPEVFLMISLIGLLQLCLQ